MTNLTAVAINLLTCPYCHAAPQARCVTKSGRRSTYTHSARTEPLYAGWRDGFLDGLRDALGRVEYARANGHSLAQVEASLTAWLRH